MLRQRLTRFVLLAATGMTAAVACGKDAAIPSAPQPDPQPPTMLQDVVIDRLPAPYYHFSYDATGRISGASFASDARIYTLSYTEGRLVEMRNNVLVNKDRLTYSYDGNGRVGQVTYSDSTGSAYTTVRFTYDGNRLANLQRSRKTATGFVVDKTHSARIEG